MTGTPPRTLDEQRAEFARHRFLAMPIAGTIVMAWLVFAIAIPFFMIEPTSLPLTVGILAGLMWVPFSWMIQHRVGLFHGITRTILVVAAWYLFPGHRFVVIPAVIVVIYLVTIYALLKRTRRPPEETGGDRRNAAPGSSSVSSDTPPNRGSQPSVGRPLPRIMRGDGWRRCER